MATNNTTNNTTKNAIAYYRVSTQRQGQSGLGLESQENTVTAYANGSGLKIVASYTEVESGKKNNRKEFASALAHAQKIGATLLIAKIDRLARNVFFVSSLMESGVDFVACDMPTANRLTIHIMAAMAEHEASMISTRVTDALAVAKSRGTKLGTPENMTVEAQKKGNEAQHNLFVEGYKKLVGYVKLLSESGLSLRAIANRLNSEGHKTRNNSDFTAMQVSRILKIA